MELNYIGKKISEYRRHSGISQANLAEQVGVSAKYISAVETGNEVPSLETIIAIADVLQQTPSNLFGELVSETYQYEINGELKDVSKLSPKNQKKVFAVLEALLATSDEVEGC